MKYYIMKEGTTSSLYWNCVDRTWTSDRSSATVYITNTTEGQLPLNGRWVTAVMVIAKENRAEQDKKATITNTAEDKYTKFAEAMGLETLLPLIASISLWDGISKGTNYSTGASSCPLCIEFHNETPACAGCPVREYTGAPGCRNTPFDDKWLLSHVNKDDKFWASTPESAIAAIAERDFLVSLLPSSEVISKLLPAPAKEPEPEGLSHEEVSARCSKDQWRSAVAAGVTTLSYGDWRRQNLQNRLITKTARYRDI